MPPENLYKIISSTDWTKSQSEAHLPASVIDADFIQLATEEQVPKVAAKFWSKAKEYIIITLKTSKLAGTLKYEGNPGGATQYYHLYHARIPTAAIAQWATVDNRKKCACHSNKTYGVCCGIYHQGIHPATPAALMRSRYCAYALKLADYLIDTTHPANPHFQADRQLWKKQILLFCKQTVFQNLAIKSCQETAEEGYVTFRATLKQGSNDASFTEKSRFRKLNNHWLYLDGIIS